MTLNELLMIRKFVISESERLRRNFSDESIKEAIRIIDRDIGLKTINFVTKPLTDR